MIKVCGMRDAENIRQVEALGVDMMGFIFWPQSSRYVGERPSYLPVHAKRVGVFVDEDPEHICRIADEYQLDFIQLHGHESPEMLNRLSALHPYSPHREGVRGRLLIKAFNIATADDFEQTKPYEGIVDYFLFDTKGKSLGGNGEKFDWNVLDAYQGNTPFILSGGIGPSDAECLKAFHHPRFVGIDLNSRFETAPGMKDVQSLRNFLIKIRNNE
jgi:phosphoribosylanthranilate isomerase